MCFYYQNELKNSLKNCIFNFEIDPYLKFFEIYNLLHLSLLANLFPNYSQY